MNLTPNSEQLSHARQHYTFGLNDAGTPVAAPTGSDLLDPFAGPTFSLANGSKEFREALTESWSAAGGADLTPDELDALTTEARAAALNGGTLAPRSLADCRGTWRRWFGDEFDLQYLDVVLAVAASGLYLNGDPVWLQIIGGPGVGKTETIGALGPAGALVASTISGPAALLSGTPDKDRAKDATGGLLRELGDRGLLVIKDFTSILSMHGEKRTETLGALREVYDGSWRRNLGSDGGRFLLWHGRVTVIAAVTGVYDEHYSVIAAMGDRFVLLRLDSEPESVRRHATMQAMQNTEGETAMRVELSEVVAGFLLSLDRPESIGDQLSEEVAGELFKLADLVTRARSEVARDFKGEPQYPHAPEMPTRFAKQLVAVYRGALLIGLDDKEALAIVRRLAHDSIPPARRKLLLAVATSPGLSSRDLAAAVGMARTTSDRTLRELALHHLVDKQDDEYMDAQGQPRTGWLWYPSASIPVDVETLRPGFGGSIGTNRGKLDADPIPEKSEPAQEHLLSTNYDPTMSEVSFPERGPDEDLGLIFACTACGKALVPIRAGQTQHTGCESP